MTRTSKMPGLSYSLPAPECQTGSKLRKIKGTPCFDCYAMKGNYIRYPAIKKVVQLKDDQYIEDLTFKVMDQIEEENEPGWKARYENK